MLTPLRSSGAMVRQLWPASRAHGNGQNQRWPINSRGGARSADKANFFRKSISQTDWGGILGEGGHKNWRDGISWTTCVALQLNWSTTPVQEWISFPDPASILAFHRTYQLLLPSVSSITEWWNWKQLVCLRRRLVLMGTVTELQWVADWGSPGWELYRQQGPVEPSDSFWVRNKTKHVLFSSQSSTIFICIIIWLNKSPTHRLCNCDVDIHYEKTTQFKLHF